MGKVATYCGQVAYLRVGNDGCSIQQKRILRAHQGRRFQLCLARKAADLQEAAIFFNVRKPGDAVDINEMAWPRQPQFHHGNKTLSTAQDLGVITMLLQQSNGLRDSLGSEIFESWRNHGTTSFNIKISIATRTSRAL